jgi:hypothetical protein
MGMVTSRPQQVMGGVAAGSAAATHTHLLLSRAYAVWAAGFARSLL